MSGQPAPDAPDTPDTPVRLMRWAARDLARHGIDSADTEARRLMAHVLGVDVGRLLLVDHVEPARRAEFEAAVDRRAAGVPLQHITGRVGFGTVELAVGPGVFIPRPETELIVEWALRRLPSPQRRAPLRIVDLCSGSGALALAIAHRLPAAEVVAVEVDDAALTWLRRNVERLGPAGRVHVHRADVTDHDAMSALFDDASVDLVVSNPPYVPTTATVGAEVAHDPDLAVYGGPDGMQVITPMIAGIARVLAPRGSVAIEHDDTTAGLVAQELRDAGVFADIESHRDLAGRPRFVTAVRSTGVSGRSVANPDMRG